MVGYRARTKFINGTVVLVPVLLIWVFFFNLKYKILLQKNYHLHILSFYEALKYIQSKNIYCVTKYQIY